jgi:hypothetical protein
MSKFKKLGFANILLGSKNKKEITDVFMKLYARPLYSSYFNNVLSKRWFSRIINRNLH